VGFFRPIVLWPVPNEEIGQVADTAQAIIVPEMNMGQYVHPVREAACGKAEVVSLSKVGGLAISSNEILEKIREVVKSG